MAPNLLARLRHTVQDALTPPVAKHEDKPLTEQERWDAALATYAEAKAKDEAARASGEMGQANRAFDALFPLGWKTPRDHPEVRQQYDAAMARVTEAEDRHWQLYGEPRFDAETALYATPAPNLAALVEKIAVAEAEEAPNAHPHIYADVRRLVGGEA